MSPVKGVATMGALTGATLLGKTAALAQAKASRDATFQQVQQARQSWTPGPAAARVSDQVKHKSFWAALAGAIVGAALTIASGVAIIAAFSLSFPASLLVGGLAIYAAFKAAPLIEKLQNKVTGFVDDLFTTPDGAIVTGSPNVAINQLAAARAGATLPAEPIVTADSVPTDTQEMMAALGEGDFSAAASHASGALGEMVDSVPGWINDASAWAGEVQRNNVDTIMGHNDASALERLEAASSWLIGGPVVAELVTMAGGHGGIKKDVNFPEAPGDTACCKEAKPPRIAQGSGSVFINSQPAARKDDKLECSAVIKTGSGNTFIGGGQLTYLDIDAEFPPWMLKILGAINIASFILPPAALGAKVLGRLAGGLGKLAGRLPNALRGALTGAAKALSVVKNGAVKVANRAADLARKAGQRARDFARKVKLLLDPVDIATGAYVEERTDFTLGQTLPLTFTRYHNSVKNFSGLLGNGWGDNWSDYAVVSAKGNFVDIVDYTGQVYSFTFMPNDDITFNVNYAHLTLRRRGKVLELFDTQSLSSRYFYHAFSQNNPDESGKHRFYLGAITDVHNNKIVFERNDNAQIVGVVHSDGIRLRLHYHSSGYLHKIIRYNGQIELLAEYQQDKSGRLTEANAIQDYHLYYQYNADNKMVEWSDRDKTWARFDYDADGRCIKTEGAAGFYSGSLAYGEDYTDVTDSNGYRTRYWRDNDYNIVAIETPEGHTTRFTWDDYHNMTSRTSPQGRQSFYEYVPYTQLISKHIDEAGYQWLYEYNYQGRLSRVTDPLGHQWRQEYDRLGSPVHMLSPSGEKTRFRYHSDGLLADVIHCDNSSQRFAYDAHKRLAQITDEVGRHHRFSYNSRDRIETVIRPNQYRTHFRWQQQGQLAEVDHGNHAKEHYRYDRHGNLTEYEDANGARWQVEYGAFDLPVARTDALGNRWRYIYDPVTAQLQEVVNPQGESYRYWFNRQGQVEKEEDYGGALWRYAYDEDGHCISRTGGSGGQTTYDYDARGLCIAARTDEETTYYRYNATGQLIAVEQDGETVTYAYDDALRLAHEKHAGHEIRYSYPSRHGVTREIGYTDNTGRQRWLKTEFQRNAAGELTRVKLPGDASLSLEYDANGNEIRRSADKGFMQCLYYDERDRPVTRRAGRQPRMVLDVEAETDIPHPILASLCRRYHYDAADNLAAVNDDNGQTRYHLNGNGQIVAVVDPLYSESYQYDACGYLTAQSLPEEAFSNVSQRYAAGHRLAQQNDEWFEYDSGGRMTRRIVRGEGFRPQIYTYKWNGRSQLTGFIKPNGERWRYRYDALGRRTEKWCGQELRTRYIWDGDTPALIQEYRNGGLVSVRHLVFNGFHLLAQQDCEFGEGNGNGNNASAGASASSSSSSNAGDNSSGNNGERWQTRYAATDLNALPLALYSEEGNRVWRRDRTSLWGLRANKFYYQPEDKLDPGLLFAGQMEDSESGLVYNRFRYYHPESGTYLSPDPIGLAGGENTQAYVPNPLSWVDPLGLAACPELNKIAQEVHNLAGGLKTPDLRAIRNSTVSIVEATVDGKKVLFAAGSGGRLNPRQVELLEEFGVRRENIFKGASVTNDFSRLENHAERIILRNLPDGASVNRWGISWGGMQKALPCEHCAPFVQWAGGFF